MTLRFVFASLAVFALLAGCGQDVYESRLAVTSKYFDHVNTLNENLAASAQSMGGLALRPPKQFSLVVDDEETAIVETEPYYLDDIDEFPGLVGTYEATVLVDVDGQDEYRPAFIYVASNEPLIRSLAEETSEIDPLEYHTTVENMLASTFGVYLEPGKFGDGTEANVRYNEALPRPAAQGELQYEDTKNYEVVRFQPDEPLEGFDIPMQYTMYKLEGPGDLQSMILVFVPEQARTDENLPSRIRMMLETLQPVGVASRSATPGGGGGMAF